MALYHPHTTELRLVDKHSNDKSISLTEHFFLASNGEPMLSLRGQANGLAQFFRAVRVKTHTGVEGINVLSLNLSRMEVQDGHKDCLKHVEKGFQVLAPGSLLLTPFMQTAKPEWYALQPWHEQLQNLQRVEICVTENKIMPIVTMNFSSHNNASLQRALINQWGNEQQKQAHLQDVRLMLELQMIGEEFEHKFSDPGTGGPVEFRNS